MTVKHDRAHVQVKYLRVIRAKGQQDSHCDTESCKKLSFKFRVINFLIISPFPVSYRSKTLTVSRLRLYLPYIFTTEMNYTVVSNRRVAIVITTSPPKRSWSQFREQIFTSLRISRICYEILERLSPRYNVSKHTTTFLEQVLCIIFLLPYFHWWCA